METRRFEASWPALTVAERWVVDICTHLALPEDVAYAVQACCEELATNVVRHGERRGPPKPPADDDLWFELTIARGIEAVSLRVKDNTEAFDTAAAIATAGQKATTGFQIGGLGLTLIKTLASTTIYRRFNGCNETTLGFALPATNAGLKAEPA